jgi:hypothetical protein
MVEKQQKMKGKKGKKTENTVSRGLADKRKVKSVDAIFPVEEIYMLFENLPKPRLKGTVARNFFVSGFFHKSSSPKP